MEKVTMSLSEASAFLGVSKDSLYKLVREQKIPHARVRKTILFRRDTLTAWLERQEQESVS